MSKTKKYYCESFINAGMKIVHKMSSEKAVPGSFLSEASFQLL